MMYNDDHEPEKEAWGDLVSAWIFAVGLVGLGVLVLSVAG